MKHYFITLASALVFFTVGVHAQNMSTAHLPETATQSLDDKPLLLPRDLTGDRTLLLVAFERDQRPALTTWVNGLHLATNKIAWMEVVVVGPQNAFVHAMIVRGMRRESEDSALRDKLLPIFSDQEAFAKAMGLSVKSPYAVLVDRRGAVIAVSKGEYSQAKAEALLPEFKP